MYEPDPERNFRAPNVELYSMRYDRGRDTFSGLPLMGSELEEWLKLQEDQRGKVNVGN